VDYRSVDFARVGHGILLRWHLPDMARLWAICAWAFGWSFALQFVAAHREAPMATIWSMHMTLGLYMLLQAMPDAR